MMRLLVSLFLRVASRWVSRQERRIVREGRLLTPLQQESARRAGVVDPSIVRVLVVPEIPLDLPWWLRWAGPVGRWIVRDTIGLTCGHGIYLRADFSDDCTLLVHELVHVAQYERLGGIGPFLRRYLTECLRDGYAASRLEQEAVAKTEAILRSGG